MGNCQAGEAATVVIQHPGNKVERIYWSVSAHQVMNSNPGHYLALVTTTPETRTENGTPVKQLKLLRPDDMLRMGQVYRLISFEDVLKEFSAKKCVKLGKSLKERGSLNLERNKDQGASTSNPNSKPKPDLSKDSQVQVDHFLGSSSGGSKSGVRRYFGGGGQWRPALQSIAEVGT